MPRTDLALAEHGDTLQRVNHYVRHLLADQPGVFSLSLEWITDDRVPKIVCQPVVALVMNRLRARMASKAFLYG